MNILRFTSNLVALAVLALGFTSMANAQASRTWISGVGDDANPCSRTAPCKTFAGAISKTAVGGEIDCLDPGGFGQVTITKSITFDCDSGPGGILSGAGSGIIINAAGGTVTIRSLNLQGNAQGTTGVNIINAATVHLVDMNIYGFTANAIFINNVASGVFLTVEDCRIHDNGQGIQTVTNGAAVVAIVDINRVSLWNDGVAILAQNGSRMQVHNSTIFAQSIGIAQTGLAGAGSNVTVFNTAFTGNGTALQSIGGASIGVSGNVFTQNTTCFNLAGGTISSAGNDNFVFGNAGTGALSAPTPKI